MSKDHGQTLGNGAGETGEARGQILISGASFAGLATAFWMHRLGYRVTIVEIARSLRRGGTPVDIREGVIEVVRRMGLLDRIAAQSLPPRSMAFLDGEGRRVAGMPLQVGGEAPDEAGYEVERDALLDMLFDEVKDHVEFVFEDSIAEIAASPDAVNVRFTSGKQRQFSLVFGCDGTHSAVRRLCFGEERLYSLFLENYFSLTIVNKLLLPEDTSQIFNVPGKTIMLNAYNGKTDIAFCFRTGEEISYDRKDVAQQRRMIHEHFKGVGWRVPELLEEVEGCGNFYFDKLMQIRMPRWYAGRVALVGDAGYCPSPAAGMGGSMALLGAAALAAAFEKFPGDHERAFQEYDETLRPVVEAIQVEAVEDGLPTIAPRTEEEILARNARLNAR